jgi:hypothetical protein
MLYFEKHQNIAKVVFLHQTSNLFIITDYYYKYILQIQVIETYQVLLLVKLTVYSLLNIL